MRVGAISAIVLACENGRIGFLAGLCDEGAIARLGRASGRIPHPEVDVEGRAEDKLGQNPSRLVQLLPVRLLPRVV